MVYGQGQGRKGNGQGGKTARLPFLSFPQSGFVFFPVCAAEKSRLSGGRQSSSSQGASSSGAAGRGEPLPPIWISCHLARVMSSCRGLEPSKGPT